MERALRERYKRVFDEKTGYCIEYRLDDDEGYSLKDTGLS